MKILKKIWGFFELFGRAKAAGVLARQGRSQEAIDHIKVQELFNPEVRVRIDYRRQWVERSTWQSSTKYLRKARTIKIPNILCDQSHEFVALLPADWLL